ncbi:MAG TPA: ABC transporter ATP-binding protein [Saprospiraceae bacterium]|nr:ABC transporter ATP-binding protein [Saprospiraceae bacterium]
MNAIAVQGLKKSYLQGKETISALKGIDFSVHQNELFGLIGPDGAGKTSIFRILTSLLLADEGEASVFGLDVVKDFRALRKIIGYMPGKFSLYQDLTIQENLEFFATIFETTIDQNYDMIRDIYVMLEPFKNRRAGKLSGGMKQKLALCCALIHKPKILFLDEPTTGVDAVSRKEFWATLKTIQQLGISILVSTPYMDEAILCDRVALIQNGEILGLNTPEGIIDSFDRPLYEVFTNDKFSTLQQLRKLDITDKIYPFGESLHWITNNNIEEKLISELQKRKISIRFIRAGIEDVFIHKMSIKEHEAELH